MIELIFGLAWIGGMFAAAILAVLIGHVVLQYLGVIR